MAAWGKVRPKWWGFYRKAIKFKQGMTLIRGKTRNGRSMFFSRFSNPDGTSVISPQAVGIALAASAALLWSTSGLFIKVLEVDALLLVAVRSAVGCVALLPFVRPRALRWDPWLLVFVVAMAATNVAFVVATRWTTAANAIALQSTAPAWVFLVTAIMARRIPWRYTLPIVFIGAGILSMMLEPAVGTSREGNLLGLASGVGFAITHMSLSRLRQPALTIMFMANLGIVLSCVIIWPEARQWGSVQPMEWLALGYLGTGQLTLGFVLFTMAMRRISVSQASVLTVLEPVFNPIWVFWVVGESPSAYGLVGLLLVLSGIVADVYLRSRKVDAPPENADNAKAASA